MFNLYIELSSSNGTRDEIGGFRGWSIEIVLWTSQWHMSGTNVPAGYTRGKSIERSESYNGVLGSYWNGNDLSNNIGTRMLIM